jgi:hypothetical protein
MRLLSQIAIVASGDLTQPGNIVAACAVAQASMWIALLDTMLFSRL